MITFCGSVGRPLPTERHAPCCRRQLHVRPSQAGSILLGWRFLLRATEAVEWDDGDYVHVTLGVSMQYGGRGFDAQEGVCGGGIPAARAAWRCRVGSIPFRQAG